MGAIEKFLRGRGFAKLDRYGLVLTPDDRVLSTRPAVLDDGLGGRIVGWLDGDLAAMQLDRWHGDTRTETPRARPIEPPKPPPRVAAARVIAPAAPVVAPAPPASFTPPPRIATPAPVAAPVAAVALPGVAPIAVAAAPVAPLVAAEPQVDEDEWEWEIVMARARAAAEEVEEARVNLLGASAVIAAAVITRKTAPGIAVPAVAKTEQTQRYYESYDTREASAPHVMPTLHKTMLPDTRTVLPVPQLPTVSDPRSLRPVTRTPPKAPRRYARGTARQPDTVRTQTLPHQHDENTSPYVELPPELSPSGNTSPYIQLPPEVKPSGFAHTKRVAARQR